MLTIYTKLLDVVRRLRPVIADVAKHDRNLADQLRRAITNAALNCGEGMRRRGGNRRLRYETAGGEAGEAMTAVQLADAAGYAVVDARLLDDLDHVVATLTKLGRPAR